MKLARRGAAGFSSLRNETWALFAFWPTRRKSKAQAVAGSFTGYVGRRARLMLALAALDKPNMLILDEPTDHLDIDARAELLNALNDFEGAVILVSHDRRLLEATADRFKLVANGRVESFDGDLDDYRRFLLSGENARTREAKKPTRAA